MTASKKLVNQATDFVREELVKLGFSRRERGIVTIPISEDVTGWIGLNHEAGRGDGLVRIGPLIGVRHEPLERLVSELEESDLHPYLPATISIQLGYLMPDDRFVKWSFGEKSDQLETVRELLGAVQLYAIPFMQAHCTLNLIYMSMTGRYAPPLHLSNSRIPAALFLLGRPTEAIARAKQYLCDKQERLQKKGLPDDHANRYRRFVENLSRKIGVL